MDAGIYVCRFRRFGVIVLRFSEKVVVITGAAQGIGRVAAEQIAREGGITVLVDKASLVMDVAEQFGASGYTASAFVSDLEQHASVKKLFEDIVTKEGRIDVVINNVGGTIWIKPFWEYEPEEIEKEIQRSLWPSIWCCYEAIRFMCPRRSGVIVNVGSNATRGIYRVPYAAAKGGVEALTKTLALDSADCGIRVNCVAPGGVDVGERAIPRNEKPLSENERQWLGETYDRTITETPMHRLGTPEEISSAICYMASDEASYITGQILYVAGGSIG